MDFGDITTFGMDVVPKTNMGSQWVLTRLHARYTKESLGADITFKAAPAIIGGREVPGTDGKLEHGAQPSSFNNFQARYAIRHAWQGHRLQGAASRHLGREAGRQRVRHAGREVCAEARSRAARESGARVVREARHPGDRLHAGLEHEHGNEHHDGTGPSTAGTTGKKGCLGCAVTDTEGAASAAWLAAIGAIVVARAGERG